MAVLAARGLSIGRHPERVRGGGGRCRVRLHERDQRVARVGLDHRHRELLGVEPGVDRIGLASIGARLLGHVQRQGLGGGRVCRGRLVGDRFLPWRVCAERRESDIGCPELLSHCVRGAALSHRCVRVVPATRDPERHRNGRDNDDEAHDREALRSGGHPGSMVAWSLPVSAGGGWGVLLLETGPWVLRRGRSMEVTFILQGTIASAECWWMPVPMARIETPVGRPPRNVGIGSRGTVHRQNGGGAAEPSAEETLAVEEPDESAEASDEEQAAADLWETDAARRRGGLVDHR